MHRQLLSGLISNLEDPHMLVLENDMVPDGMHLSCVWCLVHAIPAFDSESIVSEDVARSCHARQDGLVMGLHN